MWREEEDILPEREKKGWNKEERGVGIYFGTYQTKININGNID